jgi:hypothetical protein
MNGGNFSPDREGLETRKELVQEERKEEKMLLKVNRCSVTRRCLLGGGNKNKKRKRRHDAALSLQPYIVHWQDWRVVL